MILGLTAAGIPESQAVAATFVQRMFTSYLPPLSGLVSSSPGCADGSICREPASMKAPGGLGARPGSNERRSGTRRRPECTSSWPSPRE